MNWEYGVSLKELIRSDVDAWLNVWWPHTRFQDRLVPGLRLLYTHPGFRATVIYRLSHHLHRKQVRILPSMLSRLNVTLYGLDIPSSVPIGPRLYIPHPVGTVVMAERIGHGVTLVSGITIGMRKEHAIPVIGNNVYVGAGARVLGGVRIGNNVSIGANAVVLKDVPDDSTAVGVPARVRSALTQSRANGVLSLE